MIELKGDYNIFELPKNGEAICITTNGIVKQNGHAVMGAGIAKQANDILHLSLRLGNYINQYGNRAFNLGQYQRQYLDKTVIFTIFTLHSSNRLLFVVGGQRFDASYGNLSQYDS